MTNFRVKIISHGVASSTEPKQSETISVTSSPHIFAEESMCDYNILLIRLENIISYSQIMEFSKEELDEFFSKPSVIVCFSDKETFHEEILWVPEQYRLPPPKRARNYDWLPDGEHLSIVSKRGKSIEPTSNAGRFANLFNTYEWEYRCSFSKTPPRYMPIAVNISGQNVALRTDVAEGRIFIIPTPEVNIMDFEKYPTFLRQLVDVCEEEIQDLSERERKKPDWVEQQVDPLEPKLFDDFIPLYERYQTLRGARKLLYETGTRLTQIVYFVIGKMEFKAEIKEEEGRQDIEVNEDDFNSVIEVTSSEEDWINIRKTRQLLDWCQRYEREHNKKPKGILIANHFCNYPPPERDVPFTRDASKQGEDEGFCLMTTIDLYKIFCNFLKGEIDKDTVRKMFVDTKGLLKLEGQ